MSILWDVTQFRLIDLFRKNNFYLFFFIRINRVKRARRSFAINT